MKGEETDVLTVTQVARALGLRSQSVYALLRDGVLSGEKNGRDWMILAREVERYKIHRRLRRTSSRRAMQRGVIDVTATTGVHARPLIGGNR